VTPPLVSVVIATYNAGAYLPETLESALGQSHAERELIVVDDGSTDDTARRIDRYRSRIRYLHRAHGGLAAARNAGLRVATGDYVALLDADDLWHPEKLATQVAVAQRHPESGLIACTGVEFDGDRVITSPLIAPPLRDALDAARDGEVTGHFHDVFIGGNMIACPAQTLIPMHVIRRIGEFIDSGVQDYDYYLRISQRYAITVHRPPQEAPLARWRFRPGSMSGARDSRYFTWSVAMLPSSALTGRGARPLADSLRQRAATLARGLQTTRTETAPTGDGLRILSRARRSAVAPTALPIDRS
jgi:glycosyltransferase involved in cell wall biosynthesis